MKKIFGLGVALAALAASPAFAADVVNYTPPATFTPPAYVEPAAPAPVAKSAYDWSGFYAGVTAGHSWGEVQDETDDTGFFDLDGYFAGGALGYNFQNGPIVYGLEADLDWSDAEAASGTYDVNYGYVGTVRARAGYAFDGILPYLTAGVALAEVNASDDAAGGYSQTEHQLGLTAGAGVDVGLTDNISLNTEYRYVAFDGQHILGDAGAQDIESSNHQLRAGVKFSF